MFARCSALPWKLLHPSVISRGSGAGIHLTFDDGPHPVGTPKLLNLLAIANAHSTFFVNGTQALMYPNSLSASQLRDTRSEVTGRRIALCYSMVVITSGERSSQQMIRFRL